MVRRRRGCGTVGIGVVFRVGIGIILRGPPIDDLAVLDEPHERAFVRLQLAHKRTSARRMVYEQPDDVCTRVEDHQVFAHRSAAPLRRRRRRRRRLGRWGKVREWPEEAVRGGMIIE